MTKKIIIIIIIILVGGYIIYQNFVKEEEQDFILETVVKGTVIKQVSETGVVRASEEVNLSFKNSGRISNIYVNVGDEISSNQKLAKLDTADLSILLKSAQSALEIAQAEYDRLLAGASAEEIKVAETDVSNAQIELNNAKQSLEDVKTDADEDIAQAYEDALSNLDDAYLKVYNAYNTVSSIWRTYFTFNDQEGFIVTDNKNYIKDALDQIGASIDNITNDSQNKNIDAGLIETKESLTNTKNALTRIRNTTEVVAYRDTVSDADKTSLDNHRSYINLAHTNIINAQQTISLTKVTNETNTNAAQASVSTAEAKLQKAQDQLSLLKADPRQEGINLYQAQINKAKAEVSRLENEIQEATLKSPNKGQVTEVNKRQGEAVKQTESVISFLPKGPFQVEVDIYEEDVIDIETGDPVIINLVAFPDHPLMGEVVSTDPAEKLINGIVYYETTIDFQEIKPGIKPGMTADIVIETDRKEDVLVLPKNTAEEIGGVTTVRVFKDGIVKEQEIQVGLKGDDFIEVISGLEQGEEVVTD